MYPTAPSATSEAPHPFVMAAPNGARRGKDDHPALPVSIPETVAEAIRQSGATGVDVVSGVESAPGVKDIAKIKAFIAAVRGA